MSLNKKKLVAILGGREYMYSLTLRKFCTPLVRQKFKENGIDFIVATNNAIAAEQFRQIQDLRVIETTDVIKKEFEARRRESKTNKSAETRHTINMYANENNYDYCIQLDDNIVSIFYRNLNAKFEQVKKNQPYAFYELCILLFNLMEYSNTGAIGYELSCYPCSKKMNITAGFPYSFFCHRVDKNFLLENSTEDDILMSIYNGEQNKPSSLIRNCFSYSKTGKRTDKMGNRKLYESMLKTNERGSFCQSKYPEIYQRKVSYMVKNSTNQKEPFLQHKHTLRKPKFWDETLTLKEGYMQRILETLEKIREREQNYS